MVNLAISRPNSNLGHVLPETWSPGKYVTNIVTTLEATFMTIDLYYSVGMLNLTISRPFEFGQLKCS